jgi:GNAT superfamily N-acetyltransferase
VSDLELRRAEPAHVDEIAAVLSEAARWLLARGIRQWPDPFPRSRVEPLVRRGDFYLARIAGEPVATLALLWSDPTFWGEQREDAGYVHALAVRRSRAGRGLGARLLDWAEAEVVANGREFLRLDCVAENHALRRYYEKQGFQQRGEVTVDDLVAMRFERRCRATPPRIAAREIVAQTAQTRDRPVRVAAVRSQRERGRPTTPPGREGVRFLAEGSAAFTAREWREFWRLRGMQEVQLVLWASWDPIGGTAPGEYAGYAFPIASLLRSRASREALAEELGRIRRDKIGIEPNPQQDAYAAEKIGDWFDHRVRTRDW